jgi:sialate O-acetylesterase
VHVTTGTGRYSAAPIEPGPEWTQTTLAFADLRGGAPAGRGPVDAAAVTGVAIEPASARPFYQAPSGLYHAMLCPLMPYGIRGAIWYQGEGNSGRAWQYRKLLPAMIAGWRKAWGQGDFPFLIVQLPFYRQRRAEPSEGEWAELREAQLMTHRRVPVTGLAVTIDTGDAGDPHPRDKRPAGERLARWALGDVYGRGGLYGSPLFETAAFEGARVRIRFRFAEGLRAAGGGAVRGFAVAGEDRKFVWADAVVEGETVVVSSPQVARPAAVRYAWADNPDCNLVNAAGLPASPFRTDDWPGRTTEKR